MEAEVRPVAGVLVGLEAGGVALAPILGRSPFQRHLRHLQEAGVPGVLVPTASGTDRERLASELSEQAEAVGWRGRLEVLPSTVSPRDAGLAADALVLAVSAPTVLDTRLYAAVTAGSGPAWVADQVDRSGVADQVDGGRNTVPVGLRLTPASGADLGAVASLADAGADVPGAVIGVSEIDAYLPHLRRTLRPFWVRLDSGEDRARAAHHLLDATQKGVLDFPARFLHPPVENLLVRWLAPGPVTPNQITVFTGILGFAIAWLFATGGYVAGLVLAVLVNILDGVDGKLARVKLLASRFGDILDHTLDVSFEFAWYLGLGWGLSGGDLSGAPLRTAVGLILLMLGTRGVSGIYKWITGHQIHDHRAFDRGFRLVAGRRNIYVVVLLMGAAVGTLDGAFNFCFAVAAATLAVYALRTLAEAVRPVFIAGPVRG